MSYMGKISISSGPLAGKTFDVIGEMIIGRAVESAIVFPTGETNVSRRHCVISYDEKSDMFYVTDMSSNGTFMSNGVRLQNGVRTAVPAGTSIYLGTRNDSFMLMHVHRDATQAVVTMPAAPAAMPESRPLPVANQQYDPEKAKNLGLTAFILSIAGMIGGWFPIVEYFTFAAAVLAIILGAIARKRLKALDMSKTLATWGLVLGIIAVVVTLVVTVLSLIIAGSFWATVLNGNMYV